MSKGSWTQETLDRRKKVKSVSKKQWTDETLARREERRREKSWLKASMFHVRVDKAVLAYTNNLRRILNKPLMKVEEVSVHQRGWEKEGQYLEAEMPLGDGRKSNSDYYAY